MPGDYRSDQHVPPHPEVPFAKHRTVLGHLCEADCATVARLDKTGSAAGKATDTYRNEVRKLFGGKKHDQWIAFVDAERGTLLRDVLAARRAASPREAMARLRKDRRAKALAFMEKLGIDPAALAAARRRAASQLVKGGGKPGRRPPGKLMHPDEAPKHVREHSRNPLTWYGPDEDHHYQGWNWSLYWWRTFAAPPAYGGMQFEVGAPAQESFAVDSDIGEITNHNGFEYYAGSADRYLQVMYTAIGFWYQMNATGPLQAFVEAMPLTTDHQLTWTDVTGPSGWVAHQTAEITLKVTDSRASDDVDQVTPLHELSWTYSDGDPGGGGGPVYTVQVVDPENTQSRSEAPLPRGQMVVAELLSGRVYGRGEWVWVQAGIRTTNEVLTDFLLMNSLVNQRWFFPRVGVEAATG